MRHNKTKNMIANEDIRRKRKWTCNVKACLKDAACTAFAIFEIIRWDSQLELRSEN
jgi:hypothetical protein